MIKKNIIFRFYSNGTYNGIAIWIDWYLDEETMVSCGPIDDVAPGQRINWDPHTRQGVHLPHDVKQVTNENFIKSSFKFDPKEGTVQFLFETVN